MNLWPSKYLELFHCNQYNTLLIYYQTNYIQIAKGQKRPSQQKHSIQNRNNHTPFTYSNKYKFKLIYSTQFDIPYIFGIDLVVFMGVGI